MQLHLKIETFGYLCIKFADTVAMSVQIFFTDRICLAVLRKKPFETVSHV